MKFGQGNIFSRMCQGFCPLWGLVPGRWVSGPGGGAWSRGVPGPGGMPGPRGSGLGGCGDLPQDGYCCGWYASYWNAFLFILKSKFPSNITYMITKY